MSATSHRRAGLMPSGPGALLGLRFLSSLRTATLVTTMYFMSVFSFGTSVPGSSLCPGALNTDANCLMRVFALSFAVVTYFPSFLSMSILELMVVSQCFMEV